MARIIPKLAVELISQLADAGYAQRVRRLVEASSAAVEALAELDMAKYEVWPVETSADLSVWEEIAPVVGTTIATVNALIAEYTALFTPGQQHRTRELQNIDHLVLSCIDELKTEMARFGMQIRSPSVVGDRWSLLLELQSYRSKLRSRAASLVFDVLSVLGECKRRDVEPGYAEELGATLVIRSTTADLARLVQSRSLQIADAIDEDLEWNARQLDKEINAFARTAAWRVLRVQDKKTILEFRYQLGVLISRARYSRAELSMLVEPFLKFAEEFSAVNQREILVQHDQEVVASVGVGLETAMMHADPNQQIAVFHEAVGQAQSLYGRNREFDAFLRRLRKTPVTADTLAGELEQFVMLLSTLGQY